MLVLWMKQTCRRRKYSAAFRKVLKLEWTIPLISYILTSSCKSNVESRGARNAQLLIIQAFSFQFRLCPCNMTDLSLTLALSLQGMFVYVHLIWQPDNQRSWPLASTSLELKSSKRRFLAKAKAGAGREGSKPWPPKRVPVKWHHLWRRPQLWLKQASNNSTLYILLVDSEFFQHWILSTSKTTIGNLLTCHSFLFLNLQGRDYRTNPSGR